MLAFVLDHILDAVLRGHLIHCIERVLGLGLHLWYDLLGYVVLGVSKFFMGKMDLMVTQSPSMNLSCVRIRRFTFRSFFSFELSSPLYDISAFFQTPLTV